MSSNRGACSGKSFIVIIIFVTVVAVTIKLTYRREICGDHPKTFHAVMDYKDRFLHHISKFKVSHTVEGLNLYIYTAFLDERYNKTVLRIFAMEEKDGVPVDFKCVFTTKRNDQKVVTEMTAKRYWIDTTWPSWSPYFASEYNCVVPNGQLFTETTFKSTKEEYSFSIPIEIPKNFIAHNRQDVAVCIKPLTGYQNTYRLVEWIETLKAAGYSHIIIYQSDITGPGRHILDYYHQQGLVSVVNFPYLLSVIQNVEVPGRTDQERYALYQQLYLIAMHDCLYRFSTLYKYIAFHDLDEIILPAKRESAVDMIKRAEKAHPDAAAFMFQTAFHFEEAGKVDTSKESNLYMQSYPKFALSAEKYPKSIVSTDRSITINFNEVLDVPQKHYKSILLPSEHFGFIHHFNGPCKNKFPYYLCTEMLQKVQLDESVTRYKNTVLVNFENIVSHMQMT